MHIQQNYGHPIRLGELAALIPMSEGQFCRFFKSMTRQTPIDYINSYRIRQATELLREPERKSPTSRWRSATTTSATSSGCSARR
ncbi:hypothetical protein HMSSN036_90230 [Paenibacillus macerans]|nr:hypothetical protein HMSSN036_90230 [Paenibacillus macerans]